MTLPALALASRAWPWAHAVAETAPISIPFEVVVSDARLTNYFAASAFTVLFIDFISTLDEEINFVWNRPWSIPSGLYLWNRYTTLLAVTFSMPFMFREIESNHTYVFSDHSGICRSFIISQGLVSTLLFGTFDLLLTLRVWILYGKTRRMAYILFPTLVVEMISMITVLLIPETFLHEFVHLGPVLPGCYFTTPVITGPQFAFYAVPPLLVTFTMFILTIHKCLATLRQDKRADLAIINLFLRDAMVWLVVVFFFYGAEMIIWATARPTLTQVLVVPSLALFSLISSRILLETRSLSTSSSSLSSSSSLPNSNSKSPYNSTSSLLPLNSNKLAHDEEGDEDMDGDGDGYEEEDEEVEESEKLLPPLPPLQPAGAGPSGLVLALVLRRLGISVNVDSPRTQELFHALGMLADIQTHVRSLPPMRSYVLPAGIVPLKTFHMTPVVDPTPDRPFVELLTLGQDVLEGVLRAALKETYSCEVEFGTGTQLVSFTQDAGGVDAVIVRGNAGADSACGIVRKHLGLPFLGESRPSVKFIIADIRVEGIDEDHWHLWGDPKADSVLLRPTGIPGLFRLVVILAGSDIDYETVMKDHTVLQNTINTITGRLDLNLTEVVWIRQWTPNIRMTDTFSVGRCFLVGDAAHVHSPTGGQGLNTSAQDSFNLAWKLALVVQSYAPMTLLDSYNDERLPVIAEMLQKSTGLLDKTVGETNITGDTSRWDRGGALLMFDINYCWSPIVVNEQVEDRDDTTTPAAPRDPYGTYNNGLKAGDRAPDASELRDIPGGSVGLFNDVFDFSRHTVLVFSATTDPERYDTLLTQLARYPRGLVCCVAVLPARAGTSGEKIARVGTGIRVLEDTKGHAHTSYHGRFEGGCDIVAVRPDRIIGAVVRSPEALERYFAQIFA
ncbi:FAD binding domain-containing protein [Mycena olivaceomarginata]|nr:FAD binding domain-containing protein [Mycena olivaceomarginata]